MTDLIKKISVSYKANILDTLKKMDETNHKLLIVSDEDDLFVSMVSIGDIQRAIINDTALTASVSEILRKDITVAHENDNLEFVKQRMKTRRNEFMPVIDNNKKIIKIIFWEDLFEENRIETKINLPVVIMAGGRGTRLKPFTNVLPKALVPLEEKTVIEHIIERFSQIGITRYYISVNHKAELIEYYLGQQKNINVQIEYFKENKPLGTAGSLYLLKRKIKETFFISNCDIIIEENYHEILNYHKENRNDITIVAAIKCYPISYGILHTSGNGILDRLEEKPELSFKINTGFYIMEPRLLDQIPDETFFDMTELIDKQKDNNLRIGVFPISEKSWRDIGTWGEYIRSLI